MKHIILKIIVYPLAIVTLQCFAQDPHPMFRQYTVEDGLASSEVYQVKQDSKGYIWFATGNGVSRFNGYEFENFSMSNGLPDNTVFEIYEDHEERIWFVPISCKLSYYYKGKIYQYKYNDALQKQLKNPIKTSFCVDRNGTVFLGVFNDGVYEISKEGKIVHHFFTRDYFDELDVIQPDSSSFIYSFSVYGFLKTIKFNTPQLKENVAISEDNIMVTPSTRIIQTKNGKIFISFNEKLYIAKGMANYEIEEFPSKITWIYEDAESDLWVGTFLGGVYRIQNGDFKHKKCYLPDMSVNGVLQDKEGGFWLATEGNAVYYSPSKRILTFDKSIGLADDRINCLATDGRSVYAGSQNGFVHKISEEEKINTIDCNLGLKHSNAISSLFFDGKQKMLWVAGKQKYGFINDNQFTTGPLSRMFNRMILDSDGTYWLACPKEITKIKDQHVVSLLDNMNEQKLKRTNAILNNTDSTLYIGSMDGLWTLNKNTYSFTYEGTKDSLLWNRILDLAYTPDHLLVIATKGAGVLVGDKGHIHQINTAKGLCGDNVYRVCVDGSAIWAATNKGLNKISITRRVPFIYTVDSYTIADGLAANEINDVIKTDDKVWVATNKGLSVFYAGAAVKTSVQLPVYINKISINDVDTLLYNRYELAYNQNNIKISFIALGYKNAGKLTYRYRMLGLDNSWNYTENREIQFTTLPANNYTFQLSVLNSNGKWSTNMAQAHFIIYAPFWKKWWFALAVILLIIYLVFLFLKYRFKKIQQQREKNAELNRSLLNLKLKALRAQMNPHFTFNVMNSIQHFIVNKDEEAANRYLSKFSKLIRTILNNSEKNTVPLSDEIKALELYLDLEAMRFDERFEYEIKLDESINATEVEIPSMLIQPYVENSVKHGILPLGKKGKIKIEIHKQAAFLKCAIEDNGIGRKKAAEKNADATYKSFGTSITQERLTVINALNNSNLSEKIIHLQDANGNASGTRVEIYIPVN